MERIIEVRVSFDDNYKIENICENKNEVSQSLERSGKFCNIRMKQIKTQVPSYAYSFKMATNSSEKDFNKLIKIVIYENAEKFGTKIAESVEFYKETFDVEEPNYSIHFKECIIDIPLLNANDTHKESTRHCVQKSTELEEISKKISEAMENGRFDITWECISRKSRKNLKKLGYKIKWDICFDCYIISWEKI